MNWLERKFSGHISFSLLGVKVTIYGFNAMHVAVNIFVRRGWLCFHPPLRVFRHWWPGYLYYSPDATPCTAWWGFGRGFREDAQGKETRRRRRAERGYSS